MIFRAESNRPLRLFFHGPGALARRKGTRGVDALLSVLNHLQTCVYTYVRTNNLRGTDASIRVTPRAIRDTLVDDSSRNWTVLGVATGARLARVRGKKGEVLRGGFLNSV